MRKIVWGGVFSLGLIAACDSEAPTAGLPDSGQIGVPDGGGGGQDAAGFAITTAELAPGTIGVVYSAKLMAAGGVEPYAFVLVAGDALPNGLILNADGTIEGTPTIAGSATFTVQASDSAVPIAFATATFTLLINPPSGDALVITSGILPQGTAAIPYSAQLEATGGLTPYSWSIASGSLPSGLSLSADGTISGTPLAAGSSTFLVQVTDAATPNQLATRTFTIAIKPATGTPLIIETTALADGTVNVAYTSALAASGGTPPYTWSLAAGTNLPSGLVLASTGEITGTPVQAGATTFTVQVLDSGNPSQLASAQLSITVAPEVGTSLEIVTASLPDATLNQTYTATVAAIGGTTPYAFSVSAGALPPGLTLLQTGELGGAALQPGTFAFTIQCTDAANPPQVATRSLSITVLGGMGDPLSITTAGLPDGVVGQAYTVQLGATGGSTPYQWALDPASALPSGLALDTLGNISGTPDTAGRFAFTILVVDSSMPQQTASAALSITIASMPGATLVITTASLPDATAGVSYAQQLAAMGGTTPYTWSLVQGTLPAGLTLDTTGSISGTTMVAGTYGFTVEVADVSMPQQTSQATFTLNVNPPANQGLIITTSSLPRATVGVSYGAQLAATGGTTPYAWALESGSLPPGLTLTSTGAIWGIATVAGSFSFTVSVTDSAATPATAQKQLALIAFARPGLGLAILNQNLPQGTVGRPYSAHFAVAGGTRPYDYSISSGALPDGLSLDAASGQLTGTPTVAGSFGFTVRVTDTSMPQLVAERSYTLTIRAGVRRLRITTNQLARATANVVYQQALTATGGTPPYTWSINSGSLPMGLTLTSTGSISGTATMMSVSPLVIQVSDSGTPAQTATRMYTLMVR